MSKGFLIFAQNTADVNYVKQAYALALSIKHSQKNISNVSIVTNDTVPAEYLFVFDKVIPIPWAENITSRYSAEHRWKLYHVTPYDETIVLDSDMLVLDDLSLWWNYCSNFDVTYCSRVKTYQNEVAVDNVYRKSFVENSLPNVYSALHYFKKCDNAKLFYNNLEFVINNWQKMYSIFAPEQYQDWLSMDLAVAIAVEFSGMWSIVDTASPLEFVHMKPGIQTWPVIPESWQMAVQHYTVDPLCLYVGNIRQTGIFHYVEKDFLTDGLLSKLEVIK